jgi:exosortase A-associated hydrolase 1
MARHLASAGFPVLRFDYRGMGDSDGEPRSFEAVGADIAAAIEAFYAAAGDALDGVVLFGLCDAASAALMHCARERKVRAMVLANPWVRSEAGEAKSYVRHYYGKRLLQGSFWQKLFAGETRILASIRDFSRKLAASHAGGAGGSGFIAVMRAGLLAFRGPVLLFQSGRDLTAGEFDDLCADDPDWRSALQAPEIELVRLPDADHTFSRRDHLDEVARRMVTWLQGLRPARDSESCR